MAGLNDNFDTVFLKWYRIRQRGHFDNPKHIISIPRRHADSERKNARRTCRKRGRLLGRQ